VDISRVLKNGWELFVKDIGPLLVGYLIAGILSFLTLLILAGPLFGGLFKMVFRRVREGRTAEIGDVFDCMDQFGTLLLAVFVLSISIGVGLLFLIVPGVYLATIWIYVIPLIVDKKLSLSEAMSRSKELVMANNIGTHFAMLLLIGIGSAVLSGVTGGAGSLLVGPLTIAIIGAMYFIVQGESDKLAVAVANGGVVSAATPPSVGPPAVPAGELLVADAGGPGPGDLAKSSADAGDAAANAAPDAGPAIDPQTGRHAPHCSQCGAALGAADEFCTVCATEVSGGDAETDQA
jgi:hypothetical protein